MRGADGTRVGRISGPYEFDGNLGFPHKRPVEWLLLNTWRMPDQEGPRTTVYELGKSAANLLELERAVVPKGTATVTTLTQQYAKVGTRLSPPYRRSISSRHESRLFYGAKAKWFCMAHPERARPIGRWLPPGNWQHATRSRGVSRILPNQSVSAVEQRDGLVRVCTFHPGWGYEDFIEGLRPATINGQMVFEARDGIFKRLCVDAASIRTGTSSSLWMRSIAVTYPGSLVN